jgi:hypothetical protein
MKDEKPFKADPRLISRMAGNIAAGVAPFFFNGSNRPIPEIVEMTAKCSVDIAQRIALEVETRERNKE